VCLHPLFGNNRNLSPIIQGKNGLLEAHKPCIQLDLRNHGKSEYSDSMSYDEVCADVLELMNVLNIPKFHLLGHSFGGKVAMHLAIHCPDRVLDTVIVDIAPVNYVVDPDWEIPQMISAMRSIDLTKIQDRRQVDDALKRYIPDARRRTFFLSILEQKENGGWDWRVNLDGIEKNLSTVGSFPETLLTSEKEILFIRGGQSNRLNEKYQIETKKMFPNAIIQTIEGAGHWVYADNLTLFKSMVLKHFN
jgi:esterase